MFTIKYVMTDATEMLDGPFESVGAVFVNTEGRQVDPDTTEPYARQVNAHRPEGGTVQYGPIFRSGPTPGRVAFVYVMNDRGTTVAKYEL